MLTLHDRSLQFHENTFWLRPIASNNEFWSLFFRSGADVWFVAVWTQRRAEWKAEVWRFA